MNLQAWNVAQCYKTLGLIPSAENQIKPNHHVRWNQKAIQTKKLLNCQQTQSITKSAMHNLWWLIVKILKFIFLLWNVFLCV